MTIGEPKADLMHSPLPFVSVEHFKDNERARFLIAKTAIKSVVAYPELQEASSVLRANVYIDEMGFLPESHRDEQGRETDEDDYRSVHFAVTEKAKDGESARLIGTSRLITKQYIGDDLPIERLYPEIFVDNPAPQGSLEVSRFISRHEDEFTQHKVALSLIRAMTHYGVKQEVPYAYFVIEEPLWDLLNVIGLPMEPLSELKKLEEYGNTLNMAIRISPPEVIDTVTRDKTGTLLLTQFFQGEEHNDGLGFYRGSLVGGGNV